MRLDKFLADMEFGSRKEVKQFIKKGRVKVNGVICKSDKTQVDELNNHILFDDELVHYQNQFYYILHKPQGVISATVDNFDETVVDLLDDDVFREDLFPVGRLDKDTEGLLILTNDGALAHQLLSPKKHIEKAYYAKVSGQMTPEDIVAFKQGLTIDQKEVCLPAELTILSYDEALDESEIELVLHEGKFHQVKRMVQAVGKEVTYLKRIRMGQLVLPSDLALGEYRELTTEELELLS